VKPLSVWVKQEYVKPKTDIQCLFENALTEFLYVPFWFPVEEICQLTDCDKNVLEEILVNQFGHISNEIRFANSDTWTLMNPILAPILHKYLGLKYMATFDKLSL
jgi:hypothetical protein